MAWVPAAAVCSVTTAPLPSARTDATVRLSRAVPDTAPRTNHSRSPSGDQVGSKSSHAPP